MTMERRRIRMDCDLFRRIAVRSIWMLAIGSICATEGFAADLTAFGGFQRTGQFTVQSAESGGTTLIHNFDPKTFGVYGLRVNHGKVFGGEYTAAYAPNFIDSDS